MVSGRDPQGAFAVDDTAVRGGHDGRYAVLASPLRRDALTLLHAAPGPLSVATLAHHLGLHITTVRFHLDQLERAGLVVRETEHSGRRGRPAASYRAVDTDVGAARDQMIDALAQSAASSGPSPEEDSRAAGLRWATGLTESRGDARTMLTRVAGRLGFDPDQVDWGIRLRDCPFRSAARHNPQVVCQVHLGLLQGIAARAQDGDQVMVGLVPFAEPATCHLTLTATTTAPTTRSS
jgi:predicted ArsR family transcriptional regulator